MNVWYHGNIGGIILLLQKFLHMNTLKFEVLLTWFCFIFQNSGSGIIRLISDYYYYFLMILVLAHAY